MNATTLGYTKNDVVEFYEFNIPIWEAKKINFYNSQIDLCRDQLAKKFDEFDELKVRKSVAQVEFDLINAEIDVIKTKILKHQASINKVKTEYELLLQNLIQNWDKEHLVQVSNFMGSVHFLMPYGAKVELNPKHKNDKVEVTYMGKLLEPVLLEASEISALGMHVTYELFQTTGGPIRV